MTDKTKPGFVPKSFRDAGTGDFYEGGKEHPFTPGEHANFLASGLITEKAETAKSDSKTDQKSDAKTQNAST